MRGVLLAAHRRVDAAEIDHRLLELLAPTPDADAPDAADDYDYAPANGA